MEIQNHAALLEILEKTYVNQPVEITYTDWEGDEQEDEEVTTFRGTLLEVKLEDNEFEEKDLTLRFQEDEGEVEILMEIPANEQDLGVIEEHLVRIFGTEAELVLAK
ncbi:hypothetical protein EEL32_09350 [Brevibacillus laterosporus]|uniref:Uncharacterized protein n=1 Tax=Brevibacillus laterosporus TaxID=1465 RepID=A0A502IRY7_BRELA|nr:hypothetical protein [Brevibacillus laterosporus]QDX93340.1 hypothetical protein EEL30_14170 [Brevibacillus laterosporus]RAP24001.1 hypothetical protein C2W64_02961 [Brevibacillus laterosporus]TPG73085.1 hypothetical protein EEL31_01525 [Brevibacillus laterosporus]TPG88358.1 hypothetical protein EEL32_09350 [Brevibacillus laterosporus]